MKNVDQLKAEGGPEAAQNETPPIVELGNGDIKEDGNEKSLDEQRKKIIQHVIEMVAVDISPETKGLDDTELAEKQKQLKKLPYFPAIRAGDLLEKPGKQTEFAMAETDKIIGSVSVSFDDWSTEYVSRKGRAVEVAKEILQATPASLERVFHTQKPNEQIRLKRVSGPGGDVFFAIDGSHRIAGCKLVGIPEIPAQIEDVASQRQ